MPIMTNDKDYHNIIFQCVLNNVHLQLFTMYTLEIKF